MTEVTVPRGPKPVTLDLCEPCSLVWFDAREYAVLKVMYGEEGPSRPFLEQKWKWALALLGVPVERDRFAVLRRPWLTWGLVGVTTLVSVTAWFVPDLFSRFSLVPASAWRFGGLTFLTCFLLHGGILHLVGNMYFLLVFGDSVEDFLGKRLYLLLLLLATIAGNLVFVAANPGSTVPLVGASGGISGVIVFYGLQFPRVRLLIMVPSLFFYPLRIRAKYALLLWVLLQVSGALAQMRGFSHIAFLAHLGGAGVGFAFWLIWRNRLAVPPKPSGGPAPA